MQIAAAAAAASLLAACGQSGSPSTRPPSTFPPIPIATAVATSQGAWATLAMGRLSEPLNTFWELFHATPRGTWTLSTPPGVASNGGLFIAPLSSSVITVAFGPSLGLRFSPLVRTENTGVSWTTGILPDAIARAPDALAVGGTGRTWALSGSGATRLLQSRDLDTWSVAGTLSPSVVASEGCRLLAATAVATTAAAPRGVAVGGTCTSGPRAAILLRDRSSWQNVGPLVNGGASTPSEVLRRDVSSQGVAALIRTGSGREGDLVAAYGSVAFNDWSVGNPLPIAGRTVVSSSTTSTGGLVVVLGTPDGSRIAAVSTRGDANWDGLPALPQGTALVASNAGGGFDALTPQATTLVVERLAASGWVRSQAIVVPIEFGSSH